MRALALLIFAVLALCVASAGAPAEPIVIKFSHVVAEDTPKGFGARLFKERVEKRLGGRVEVQVYPNAVAFDDDARLIQALVLGEIHLAAPAFEKFTAATREALSEDVGALDVFELPFLFENSDAVRRFQSSAAGQRLLNKLVPKGIKGLAYWDNGMRVISAAKPLRVPADVRGLEFRIEPTAIQEAQFEALGAVPVRLPLSIVYEALESGLVDGQQNVWSNIWSKQFHELQSHFTETSHSYLGYMVVTGVAFWDQLPEDVRSELEIVLTEVTQEVNRRAEEQNQQNRRKIINSGVAKVAVYTDITDQKRREEELADLAGELASARDEAMQATLVKSRFLANLGHEFRTPMNSIIGFTRLVKQRSKDVLPAKQYENLDKILVSADHLLALINDVLDLSKIEAGRMEAYPVSFFLPAMIDECLRTIEADPKVQSGQVKLSQKIRDGDWALFTDRNKLKQILMNLLSNAVKFTDRGNVEVDIQQNNDLISIAVSDTGTGIAEDVIGTLFQDFRQVDSGPTRKHGGTGLGLSISRHLARLMGGDVAVESTLGSGSTFTVTIPARCSDALMAERSGLELIDKPFALKPASGQVVLAVDSDPDVIYLLQENLSEVGYEVIGASSGQEGLKNAREVQPFAITLDVRFRDEMVWMNSEAVWLFDPLL